MITHVAVRFQGVVYSLPSPNRHHNVIWHICETLGITNAQAPDDDQGFLDENGQFYRRRAALMHALKHKQVKDPSKVRHGKLYSEDVW